MDTLCRVCIAKVAKGTSLSSKIEESSNLSFFDFLNKCTTLNAREGDKLPQSICSVCDNAMKMFYSFVTQAEKSDLVLKEVLKIIVPKRKYNSHKGTPCGESAKTKEITPNENPTGPSVFILDIVKEEPQPPESTSIVAVEGAEIRESEHCESNLNHPEKDNEEPDDVVLCTDPHPAGIETVDLTDFENDVPTSALRRIIAISDDEADSERKPCEEETLANEIIGEESEDFNQGDSLHCQPSKNSTESLPYILDIVKEEPRMSESTSIVAVKDGVIDESVNSESNQDYPKVLDDMLLCTDSLPASIDTEETDSADDSPISLLKNSEQSKTFSAKESSCSNHSGDKGAKEKIKFKCEICGKRFTKNYLESYHMESHKGDKSKCDKCGKVFLHRYSLNRHMKWHNNPKASMCKICYKWLSSHESHARHMKKVHPEHPVTPKYDCGICDKSFSSQYYFDIHMEKHKTIEQKCHKCGKEFKQKHNLKRHMQLHDKPGPFKCEKCGRCYDRRYIYNGHIKICKHPGKQKQLKTKQLSSRSKKKKVVVSHESAALI